MRALPLLVLLAACAREEPLRVEPSDDLGVDESKRWLTSHETSAFTYERFAHAELVSLASARCGAVETSVGSDLGAAERAASEAAVFLRLAYETSQREGKIALAGYERRAAEQLRNAVEEARAGQPVRAAQALSSARRALDLAIEQVNETLVPPPASAPR